MNPKIEKITAEIESAKAKAALWHEKAKALEKKKEELENEEIVALFREKNMTLTEFAEFVNKSKTKAKELTDEK